MIDRKSIATFVLIALAGLMIVAGITLTGGPVHARKEKRDELRENDLRELWFLVRKEAADAGQKLPDNISAPQSCSLERELRTCDPFTQKPYTYEKLNDQAARLCADFELPKEKWLTPFASPDVKRPGCYIFALSTPDLPPLNSFDPNPLNGSSVD